MSEYIVSPDAEVDLDEILDHVQAASPRAARELLTEIEHAFGLVSDHPEAGRARDEFRAGLRSFPVGAYLVFYRRVQRGVEIVRVIHGRRDLERIAWH